MYHGLKCENCYWPLTDLIIYLTGHVTNHIPTTWKFIPTSSSSSPTTLPHTDHLKIHTDLIIFLSDHITTYRPLENPYRPHHLPLRPHYHIPTTWKFIPTSSSSSPTTLPHTDQTNLFSIALWLCHVQNKISSIWTLRVDRLSWVGHVALSVFNGTCVPTDTRAWFVPLSSDSWTSSSWRCRPTGFDTQRGATHTSTLHLPQTSLLKSVIWMHRRYQDKILHSGRHSCFCAYPWTRANPWRSFHWP